MASRIEIFLCYSREDEELRKGLEKHLQALRRQGIIDVWHDREISAGTEWEREIDKHLNSAQIILLLVSPDFMDSDYCYGIEMKRALERHEKGKARVIPVILRPVHWKGAPFGKLQALPTDAKPIMSPGWYSPDIAFYDVAEGIYRAIQELTTSFGISAKIKKSQEIPSTKAALQTPFQYTPSKQVQKSKEQLLNEGSVLINLKRYEEALIACEQAIRLDPNDARVYYNMGAVLDGLKRYEEALAACEQAIHLDPNNASAYNNKGYVLQRLGREKEAQQAFEKALQLGYGG